MKREEAIQIVSQVCAQFKGTIQDHQSIQRALQVLTEQPLQKEVDNV